MWLVQKWDSARGGGIPRSPPPTPSHKIWSFSPGSRSMSNHAPLLTLFITKEEGGLVQDRVPAPQIFFITAPQINFSCSLDYFCHLPAPWDYFAPWINGMFINIRGLQVKISGWLLGKCKINVRKLTERSMVKKNPKNFPLLPAPWSLWPHAPWIFWPHSPPPENPLQSLKNQNIKSKFKKGSC